MKNKICLVLPYAGKFHNYMNLFLHSIYKNKDILDLYILLPDSTTPEITTEAPFKLPSNVFVKRVNFINALQIFEQSLSKLFKKNVNLQYYQFNFIKKPYNFCHYRGFFNVWCEDLFKDYSHWGWIDNDLILGNLKKMLPNALDLDCHTCMGHFAFIRNIKLPREAYGPICDVSTPLYKKAYDFFVEKKDTGFTGDEEWVNRTFTRFFQTQIKNSKIVNQQNYVKTIYTPSPHELNNFTINNQNSIRYLEYNNGNIQAVTAEKYLPYLYVHFMKRTKFCDNSIEFKRFSDILRFRVHPPLTFKRI